MFIIQVLATLKSPYSLNIPNNQQAISITFLGSIANTFFIEVCQSLIVLKPVFNCYCHFNC